jgi:aminomethyltransferase
VRQRAGVFDISHMGRIDFDGPAAERWLDHVTTNHVGRLAPGQIQYSLMANERGGLIDDILVYRHASGRLSIVCNASNRAAVLDQLRAHQPARDARAIDRTHDQAMIAVQGPAALDILDDLTDIPLRAKRYYHSAEGTLFGGPALLSRTGYTGEDGFELILPSDTAVHAWEKLLHAGAAKGLAPCGLGARDTLRFEAAMPLYGHELGPDIDPYEAGLAWAVKLAKADFVGKPALQQRKANRTRGRVGLRLEGKRIAREGTAVRDAGGDHVGVVTSGTFAPTLAQSLAMALVDRRFENEGRELICDVRGHSVPARVVPLPFYRRPGA